MPPNYHPPPRGPSRYAMGFIDGENLVCRFQDMMAKGAKPKRDVTHSKDVYAWHTSVVQCPGHELIRATYYTSARGDPTKLNAIGDEIRNLDFRHGIASDLPINLHAVVVAKGDKPKSKGVDIQLCVDALTHAQSRNIHTAFLVTGDGDFIPLIEAVKRTGCQVHLAALSDGLNPALPRVADRFTKLDGHLFDVNTLPT